MGIARVTLVCNLTNDPRLNDAGTVANLRVAVNQRRKVGDEWTEVASFFDVVALGKKAELCGEYLSKGRQIAVDGQLQWREWSDKEGNNRQSVEILADEIQFLGKRDDGDSATKSDDDDGPGF